MAEVRLPNENVNVVPVQLHYDGAEEGVAVGEEVAVVGGAGFVNDENVVVD